MVDYNLWLVFLLVFARLTSFIAVAPLFSNPSLPAWSKIGLGLFLAAAVTPFAGGPSLLEVDGITFSVLIAGEVLLGLALGITANIIFHTVMVAGQLMDVSMGFAMSNLFDPASQVQSTLMGRFLNLVALMMLLAMDGHHSMLLALRASFEVVPVTGVHFAGGTVQELVSVFSGMFLLAFKLAAPVLAVVFVSEMALGLVARTVPQLNVFIMGFPLKIGLGVLVMAVIMPIMAVVFGNILSQLERDLMTIIGSFR
ncbi:MAG TPA: flagellar type III secretion system protein FliR [Clostridia bacterium]|nr:flagellar type III secretion system protein FliR [Clostridia bacterium]